MAVKPLTEEGHWGCFGPDRAFGHKMETGREIHLRARPLDGTSQLSSKHQMMPSAKLQKVMDSMMTEERLEQTEKIEHMRGLPHAIKQMLTGRKDASSLTKPDGDETMMDSPGDDNAAETSAVKSKNRPIKPSDQEIAIHETCGQYPYRDCCRACVVSTGWSDAHKRRHEEQNI